MTHKIVEVHEATFEEQIEKSLAPVVLVFYAPWCGPCRLMKETLEEFAAAHPRVTVARVNGDENPGLAQRYAVFAVPTTVFLFAGRTKGRRSGCRTSASSWTRRSPCWAWKRYKNNPEGT